MQRKAKAMQYKKQMWPGKKARSVQFATIKKKGGKKGKRNGRSGKKSRPF